MRSPLTFDRLTRCRIAVFAALLQFASSEARAALDDGELEQVAGWVAAAPDRLTGIASVDLRRPMEAVRELRRCVRELGFVGLRLLPWLWELPPDDRRYYPLYAECIELGVPFCLQVGHAGPSRQAIDQALEVVADGNVQIVDRIQREVGERTVHCLVDVAPANITVESADPVAEYQRRLELRQHVLVRGCRTGKLL